MGGHESVAGVAAGRAVGVPGKAQQVVDEDENLVITCHSDSSDQSLILQEVEGTDEGGIEGC
jgi:hypothetical protein